MYEFKYHRPATVRQAANLLIKNGDAKVIAGGHTLLPVMKQRLASPPHLVDLFRGMGYPGIVALMAVESSILPLPSELVMPPAGYLAATNELLAIHVNMATRRSEPRRILAAA